MRRAFTLIAALATCGCAMTPADIVASGIHQRITTTTRTEALIKCIPRHLDNRGGGATAIVRPAFHSQPARIVLRFKDGNTLGLIDIADVAIGSVVDLYASADLLFTERFLGELQAAVTACDIAN